MAITTRKGSKSKKLQLYRRVPKRYASVESKTFVWLSLHTDSQSEAESKEKAVWDQMIAGWEAKLAGQSNDAQARFEAARNLAEAKGFPYLGAKQVLDLPIEQLRDRFEALAGFGSKTSDIDHTEAAALLGGVEQPQITISNALELYWDLAKDKIREKSPDQIRQWKNPRKKAIKNLIEVIGNKAISEITRDDMLNFREWWMEILEEKGRTPNTANKDFTHLGGVLKLVNEMKRLNLDLPISGLSFNEGEAAQRPPFSKEWIQNKILALNALDGLNNEACAILLAMINTGCRPSEIAGLSANTIHLEGNVPYISIEPEFRQLKTKHARREIPLLGVSLDAIRAFPNGFPRYQLNNSTLSATVNKFLKENGLLETDKHTLYSLRHSFEDRMLAAKIDDRIRRDLFGHTLTRERYGKGATLEHKQEVLQATAF